MATRATVRVPQSRNWTTVIQVWAVLTVITTMLTPWPNLSTLSSAQVKHSRNNFYSEKQFQTSSRFRRGYYELSEPKDLKQNSDSL